MLRVPVIIYLLLCMASSLFAQDIVLSESKSDDDAPRINEALLKVKGSGWSVVLKAGSYRIKNTIRVEEATLRSEICNLDAFANSDAGFPILKPYLSADLGQPAIQVINGRLDGLYVWWQPDVPDNARNVAIKADQAFKASHVRIFGARDGIVTGDEWPNGGKGGSFDIEDITITASQEVGMRLQKSSTWSRVSKARIHTAKIGIEILHVDDLRLERINFQGLNERPDDGVAINIKRVENEPRVDHCFCSVQLRDINCDAYAHFMRINGDSLEGQNEKGNVERRFHDLELWNGKSATRESAILYEAAGCRLVVHNFNLSGSTGCPIEIHHDTPEEPNSPNIDLKSCTVTLPNKGICKK